MKKYKLKCFSCGSRFYSKEDVIRIGTDRIPYCGECVAGMEPSYDYNEPDEQEMIDEHHRRRYGEY